MEILNFIKSLLSTRVASAFSRVSFFTTVILLQTQLLPAQRPPEYQVKAVFLFNFTQFVEWPSTAFENPNAPLVIGILGKDPFGFYLDEAVRGEEVDGHPLIVQRFNKIDDVKACHILFINQAEKEQLKTIFKKLEHQPILTVGDMANFSKTGGMIRFFTDDNKIRIRINLNVVKDAELTISSKLLRMAEIFSPK